MQFVNRSIAKALQDASRSFAVVLVTGARQTGKSTLLQHYLKGIPAFDLDNIEVYSALQTAPADFFKYNPSPLILDEVQKTPHVFAHLKSLVDAEKRKGMYFLTGSEQFALMQNVSESLSGRVGILNLHGLSLREKVGDTDAAPFIPNDEYLKTAKATKEEPRLDIWEEIHRGDKPELFADHNISWEAYYGSYVMTYLERDVRKIVNVTDLVKFQQFMRMVAARTATVLNYASIAHDLGISEPTVKKWIGVLETTNIIYRLKPYYNNLGKRETKSPKLHFLDSGLAAYLTRWTTPGALRSGAMSGNFFESFVVSEVIKSFQNAGIIDPPIYFYRDRNKNEIDLIIEHDGVLYPIEVKQSSTPGINAAAAFKVLSGQQDVVVGGGCVVCLADRLMPIGDQAVAVPVSFL
jgi:predicted AAA+ superfamily ATPase